MASRYRQLAEGLSKGIGALGRGFTQGVRKGVDTVDALGGMIQRRAAPPPVQAERRSATSIQNRTSQRQVPLSIATIDQQIRKTIRKMDDPQLSKNVMAMKQLQQEMDFLQMRKSEMLKARQGYGARQQPTREQPEIEPLPILDESLLGRQTDPRLMDNTQPLHMNRVDPKSKGGPRPDENSRYNQDGSDRYDRDDIRQGMMDDYNETMFSGDDMSDTVIQEVKELESRMNSFRAKGGNPSNPQFIAAQERIKALNFELDQAGY